MILLNINFLLYAYNPHVPQHGAASSWWEAVMNGSELIGLPNEVSLGFIRIVTHSRLGPAAAIVTYLVKSDAPAGPVSADTVIEQSETAYDRGGNAILQTRRERFHDATGTGPLNGPTGTAGVSPAPSARRSYAAFYQDPIGRSRYSINIGTNGGAAYERPDLPPAPSDTALVSETRYAADGQPGSEIGPDGTIAQTTRDRLGQPLRSVEALGTPAQRVTRFRWHASGQMSHLILENPATGEQVTEWLFGTTLPSSFIARNDLASGKVWPTGESESYLFNRQGNVIQRTDPNGSVRQFTYDKLGKPLDDTATTVAAEVDGTMRRVSIAYNNRGQRDTVTTYDAASGGAVINQVKFEYDAFGLQTADRQAHDGPVDGSTPSVSYTYTNGSGNVLRRTSVTAPSGKQVNYAYGSGGSLDDVLNRVASLKIHGDTPNLVEYTWAGFGRLVTLTYPTPDAALSYLQPSGVPGTGDAGDPMTGYDRFGRTVRMPWRNGTSGDALADVTYGYDRASRRTWRGDLTPDSDAAFDRAYGYDALGQVKTADRGTLNENRTAIGGIPQEAEAWQYDEQGNWLEYDKVEDGTSVIDQTRRSNVSNQIVAIDGSNEGVAYDKNGNMVRIPTGDALTGAPRKLVWNAWDQLVEVRVESTNALIQRNAYDGLFRRTTRTLANDSVIHQYYNDQWKPIEERRDAATDPLAVYYWGARKGHRDDLIRHDRDTDGNGTLDQTLWCLMDYFDPITILNSAGVVQERYAYSAFGVPLILAPDYTARSSSDFDWDFLFHGQFTDAETGYQNYGYRFYLPAPGVWANRDRIGEKGSWNIYLAAQNSFKNNVDFLGLTPCSEFPWVRLRSGVTGLEGRTNRQVTGPIEVNGCGGKGGSAAPFPSVKGVDFTPACNEHDICYGTCGSTQADCDFTFLRNTQALCFSGGLGIMDLQLCLSRSAAYYAFVNALGSKFWEQGQNEYCEWECCNIH